MSRLKEKAMPVLLSITLAMSFIGLIPSTAFADINGYNQDDINFVNGLIQANGLDWDEWYDTPTTQDPPADWDGFIIWNSSIPKEITALNLDDLGLTALPDLPASVSILNARGNLITDLPDFTNSLNIIDVSGDPLNGLPDLPINLVSLEVADCGLVALPNLPATLTYLDASDNALPGLPAELGNLQEIYVSGNLLTGLPLLPASLKVLNATGNMLTALPNLPAGLEQLYVGNNQLTGLPDLPTSLFAFDLHNNLLAGLPDLPASLQYFDVSSNLLTALPDLPGGLLRLDVGFNQLTGLPALPEDLEMLIVESNQLPALPALPLYLNYLDIENNSIQSLDISGLFSLGFVYVSGNPLIQIKLPNLVTVDAAVIGNGTNYIVQVYMDLDGLIGIDMKATPNAGSTFVDWLVYEYDFVEYYMDVDDETILYVDMDWTLEEPVTIVVTARFHTPPTTPGTGDLGGYIGLSLLALTALLGTSSLIWRRRLLAAL